MSNLSRWFCASMAFTLLLFFALPLYPQALAPNLHPQFLNSSGQPLAGGFLYSYAAGTSTLQATYADSGLTIQNANPIPLDATGSPSNSSGAQVEIWLSNNSYKFCAYDSSNVQQWCADNVSSYQILVNLPNITFNNVTVDPTGSAGMLGYRSDIPCFRGYTSFWDCFVRATDLQVLTNKTIDVSANTVKNSSNTVGHYLRNNGTQYVDSAIQASDLPAITQSYANSAVGTGAGLIAKLVTTAGASQAQTTATTDTGGAVGICVSGCGATGTAQISTVGNAACVFDAATTAGDYVQISSTVAGNCHDASVAFPTNGSQVLGRVLSTNAAAGTYTVALFGTEIRGVAALTETTASQSGLTTTSGGPQLATILTPAVNGLYRVSVYAYPTTLSSGCTTNPQVQAQVSWTDVQSGSVFTQGGANSANLNIATAAYFTIMVYAKGGAAIQGGIFVTTAGSSCTTNAIVATQMEAIP